MIRRSIIPLMLTALLLIACAPALMSESYDMAPGEPSYAMEEMVEYETVSDEGGAYIHDST
ncbi:MAG: hypothetical protein MUO76_15230, partial [Anaerolineaceae bacterium]|nr:hypothetical protein [Anaerolineaceae bacterium]